MNADVLGWRAKFAVLGPSTNTIVQPDFDDLRPDGVTNHYSRLFVENMDVSDDKSFMALTDAISASTELAMKQVMTCGPDYVVMGMSAVTFYGGVKGAEAFRERIVALSGGLGVSTGAMSLVAALKAYGGVKRISFLSPYFPVANAEVRRFFEESGFTVVRDDCLRCASPHAIAEVTPERVRNVLLELDGDDVDAIVQVGTNLSAIRLAAAAELFLAKPIIAINTATYWHALRAYGISDRIHGFGKLLEEH
jgi:maleate isomerase